MGNISIVEFLLIEGADIDSRVSEGSTALMAAAENGSLDTVSCLLYHGAEVNVVDDQGHSALARAQLHERDALAHQLTSLMIRSASSSVTQSRSTAIQSVSANDPSQPIRHLQRRSLMCSRTMW